MINEEMYKQIILDFAEDFFRIMSPGGKTWRYRNFELAEHIPSNVLNKVEKCYENLDLEKVFPILWVKDGLTGPIDHGILITDQVICYYLYPNRHTPPRKAIIELSLVKSLEFKLKKIDATVWLNGKNIAVIVGWFKIDRFEVNSLNGFFAGLIAIRDALEKCSNAKSLELNTPYDRIIKAYFMKESGILDVEDYNLAKCHIINQITCRTEQTHALAAEDEEKIEDILRSYAVRYYKSRQGLKFLPLYFAPNISQDLLDEARALYANYDPIEENPRLLFRQLSYTNAGDGFLVTSKAMYWHLNSCAPLVKNLNYILLDDLASFRITPGCKFWPEKLWINGLYVADLFSTAKQEITVLNDLMQEIININNCEKVNIRSKYHLSEKDPLILIEEFHSQYKLGNIIENEFKQRKNELLRVV